MPGVDEPESIVEADSSHVRLDHPELDCISFDCTSPLGHVADESPSYISPSIQGIDPHAPQVRQVGAVRHPITACHPDCLAICDCKRQDTFFDDPVSALSPFVFGPGHFSGQSRSECVRRIRKRAQPDIAEQRQVFDRESPDYDLAAGLRQGPDSGTPSIAPQSGACQPRACYPLRIYDGFASLPADVQQQITAVIGPSYPEVWVRTPIPDLGGRTFLEVINSSGGQRAVADYFERVSAFEHKLAPQTFESAPAARAAGPENLGPLLHFDDADLDANRAGSLSESQRKRLWRLEVLKVAGAAILLGAGALFNVALIAGWMTAHGRGAGAGLGLMLIGIALAAISAPPWLDLARGKVMMAEGDLRATEQVTRSSTIHYFTVDGMSFNVSKAAHDELRAGRRRVYYLRRSKTLLSVEPSN